MPSNSETAQVFATELLATVGHEFRGPLTTIQGYATTLLRHEQQLTLAERQDFLYAISDAGARLNRLIDRFLQLAQLETHVQDFFPEPVDLRALAQEAVIAAQRSRPGHLLLTASPAPTHLPEIDTEEMSRSERWTLAGDRRLLRTLLDLLLENALLYSASESSVEVFVDAREGAGVQAALQKSDSESGAARAVIVATSFQPREPVLVLRVRDHGIGIEPTYLSLIFQRFYRIDTGLTRETNGLGLGLALCQEIVARHQGMLWVESVVGEGSTFTVVLPVRQVEMTSPARVMA